MVPAPNVDAALRERSSDRDIVVLKGVARDADGIQHAAGDSSLATVGEVLKLAVCVARAGGTGFEDGDLCVG